MFWVKAKTEKAENAEPELGNEFRASARYDASRTESVDPEYGFLTKTKERRRKGFGIPLRFSAVPKAHYQKWPCHLCG